MSQNKDKEISIERSDAMIGIGGVTGDKKWLCGRCGFLVKKEGHEERCQIRISSKGGWSKQRKLAWYGDALLAMDVRIGVMQEYDDDSELGDQYQRLTNSETQSGFMNGLKDKSWFIQPTGSSDHNIATAFECNYVVNKEFRLVFLAEHFGDELADDICRRSKPPDITGLTY